MHKNHHRVVSTSCACPTTTSPVTVTCPAFTTRQVPVQTVAPVTTLPAVAVPTTAADLNALLSQLGITPTAAITPTIAGLGTAPQQVFVNPVDQLAALNPLAALAATNPTAALSSKSPTLQLFNPAVNPLAALLQFNPGAAPALALLGGGKTPFGVGKSPFTGFGKW